MFKVIVHACSCLCLFSCVEKRDARRGRRERAGKELIMSTYQSHIFQEVTNMFTCIKCSSEKRDCLFLPCGHVTLCWECSKGATVCQICKGDITERSKASPINSNCSHGNRWCVYGRHM